ncbi:MAG: hypothetical protein AABX51_08760 [Nanoarchaeota archaeon]
MTIRLDLQLEDLLRQAGWDGQNHTDYGRKFPAGSDNYNLPFTFTHAVKLTENDIVVHAAVRFQNYHEQFLRAHYHGKNTFGVSNRHLIQFYSEPLSNIFAHGGDEAREKDTIIQLFQPSETSRFVLVISNPHAESWNPQTIESKGRGGHDTFSQGFALVSYANSGRDFLALITPPL